MLWYLALVLYLFSSLKLALRSVHGHLIIISSSLYFAFSPIILELFLWSALFSLSDLFQMAKLVELQGEADSSIEYGKDPF